MRAHSSRRPCPIMSGLLSSIQVSSLSISPRPQNTRVRRPGAADAEDWPASAPARGSVDCSRDSVPSASASSSAPASSIGVGCCGLLVLVRATKDENEREWWTGECKKTRSSVVLVNVRLLRVQARATQSWGHGEAFVSQGFRLSASKPCSAV